MKKTLIATGLAMLVAAPFSASAADYVIDSAEAHASVNFRVSHLGYSFTQGRFSQFEGTFSYDPANIAASKVNVTVNTASVDSNHAERDKHIRSEHFIDADKYPTATFVSTQVVDKGNGNLDITGDLTLHGHTKPITISAHFIGAGEDPWGGERAGFSGTTRLEFADFDIPTMGDTNYAEMDLYVEGIKQ